MKSKIIYLLLFVLNTAIHAQNLNLIPQPKEMRIVKGNFILTDKTTIQLNQNSLIEEANLLKDLLKLATGFELSVENKRSISTIHLILTQESDSETYQLNVKSNEIEIKAANFSGFSNAFQTILQLLPPEIYSSEIVKNKTWKIPNLQIKDQPKYSWRGAMLDVSRQFYGIGFLKNYINWMAAHKLNIFHLHLTDDEGWRIEINSYPKLTSVGAWRGPDEALKPSHGSGNQRYGGFYTQSELKELVLYAAKRNIQILPEIDVPGHSKSVAASYPEILCDGNDTTKSVQGVNNNVWCAGREQNFEMLDKIIGEVAAIFPIKYIHIGGDEVNFNAWQHCSQCNQLKEKNHYIQPIEIQNYFISRMEKIVEKYGKTMIGWNEILENPMLDKTTIGMVWTSNEAIESSIKKGHSVILCPASYFYLDMAQGFNERGHNWATFLPLERLFSFKLPSDSLSNKMIIGIQANLWAEYLDKPSFQTEYQSYPRLCGLSELAWNGNKMPFKSFEKELDQNHYNRLYSMGIHFRVPSPNVKIIDGRMHYTNEITDSKIVFTTDSTLPTKRSKKLVNNVIEKSISENPNKALFRRCFKDSLLSPVSSIEPETIGLWNPELIKESKSNVISIFFNQYPHNKEKSSIILKYLYGSTEIAIKRIRIYCDKNLIYEKINDKPFTIFSSTPIMELSLSEELLSKNGDYRVDLEVNDTTKTDSYGIVLLK